MEKTGDLQDKMNGNLICKTKSNGRNFWLAIIYIVIFLILILSGFIFGYFFGNKECLEQPLFYGVKKLNEKNNDNYYCVCYSSKEKEPLRFNSDGVIFETMLETNSDFKQIDYKDLFKNPI